MSDHIVSYWTQFRQDKKDMTPTYIIVCLCIRVLQGKVFGTLNPYCPVIFLPDPDRTEK